MEAEAEPVEEVAPPAPPAPRVPEDTTPLPPNVLSSGTCSTKAWRMGQLSIGGLPAPYRVNTPKYQICVDYVNDFRKRFVELFPARKPLLLMPKNEAGVEKCVCTTLKPTKLPYEELYHMESLATFVAGFLEFEPLVGATTPPTVIPSPSFTLQWQVGDSFDYSMLLCSFLLGAGYDAYVVHGYAPRWVTECDQSREACPQQGAGAAPPGWDKPAAAAPKAGEETKGDDLANQYKLQRRFLTESQFLVKQGKLAQEARKSEERAEAALMEEDDEAPLPDDLPGKRVHAWVLVAPGKRHVDEYTFIEPTTGRFYSVDASPYTAIEAVWNAENYFVNMQVPVPDAGKAGDPTEPKAAKKASAAHVHRAVKDLDFDLMNGTNWEFVFITPETQAAAAAASGSSEAENAGDEDGVDPAVAKAKAAAAKAAILDVPPSWVAEIGIDRGQYRRRYGKGKDHKVILYKRAVLELFAEYAQEQGIASRLTIFSDNMRSIPVEVRETFKHRMDKLVRRVRRPLEGLTHEYFAPGRPRKLKELVSQVGEWHKLRFYTEARLDGLSERHEMIGRKMVEHFEGRDDYLTFRSVTALPDGADGNDRSASGREIRAQGPTLGGNGGSGPEMMIRKMAEKFARNPAKPASEDIAKRTFILLPHSEARIVERFHYAKHRITETSREFRKDSAASALAAKEAMGHAMRDPINSSSMSFGNKSADAVVSVEGQAMLVAEKACLDAVRDSKRESEELIRVRWEEEQEIVMRQSIFDRVKDKVKESHGEEAGEEEKDRAGEEHAVDYLTPFLDSNNKAGKDLPKKVAEKVKEECLKALKERLVERANIIQRRLDKENEQLAKRQAAFQRSRDPVEGADEEYEKFCMDAMFRIQILEQRLQKHEETAMDKYEDLIKKLKNDPRLSVLNG